MKKISFKSVIAKTVKLAILGVMSGAAAMFIALWIILLMYPEPDVMIGSQIVSYSMIGGVLWMLFYELLDKLFKYLYNE